MTDQEYANKVQSLVGELNELLREVYTEGIHAEIHPQYYTVPASVPQEFQLITIRLMRIQLIQP